MFVKRDKSKTKKKKKKTVTIFIQAFKFRFLRYKIVLYKFKNTFFFAQLKAFQDAKQDFSHEKKSLKSQRLLKRDLPLNVMRCASLLYYTKICYSYTDGRFHTSILRL